MSTLDELKKNFEGLEEELQEFYEDNKDVIGHYKELKAKRAELIGTYAEEARRMAAADSKSKGIVKVGHFEFMRKNHRVIDRQKFLTTPEGKKAVGLGLFTVHQEFVAGAVEEVEDFMAEEKTAVGYTVRVVLDEQKLKDLDKAGELKLPKDCVTDEPMKPALQKGPKAEDY